MVKLYFSSLIAETEMRDDSQNAHEAMCYVKVQEGSIPCECSRLFPLSSKCWADWRAMAAQMPPSRTVVWGPWKSFIQFSVPKQAARPDWEVGGFACCCLGLGARPWTADFCWFLPRIDSFCCLHGICCTWLWLSRRRTAGMAAGCFLLQFPRAVWETGRCTSEIVCYDGTKPPSSARKCSFCRKDGLRQIFCGTGWNQQVLRLFFVALRGRHELNLSSRDLVHGCLHC